MATEGNLSQSREELKSQIASGQYDTVVDKILDGIGNFLRKIFKLPVSIPAWISGLVIVIVMIFLVILPPIISNEFSAVENQLIFKDELISIAIAYTAMVSIKYGKQSIYATWKERLLDTLDSQQDLANFHKWLMVMSNKRWSLIIGFLYGISFAIIIPIRAASSNILYFGVTKIIFLVLSFFQGGLGVYYFFLVLSLSIRMRKYKFALFSINPSQSEPIEHLSNISMTIVYLAAINMTIGSLGFFYADVLEMTPSLILFLIILWWIPLTAFFIFSQQSLQKIIIAEKWKTLNRLQEVISGYEINKELAEGDTINEINKLISFHDQIKSTPSSALNVRAGLNFINSLLLPTFASIIANIETILSWFR